MILAHYMAWFEAKPARPGWGWHWTMNAFEPDKVQNDRRPLASHYYPLIGPYDSGDGDVLEYHLLTMKLAGIDGVIVDWYGRENLFDYAGIHRNTQALLDAATRYRMTFAVCYEDQTVPKLVEAKRIEIGDRVAYTRRELDFLRQNWFRSPAYLKDKGKPVLLSFGYGGLSDDEWAQVLQGTDAPLYLSEHHKRPVASGAFDWPLPQKGLASLDTFYTSAKTMPTFLPVAFPRFHDIYKEAKVGDGYGEIPDEQGRTFTTTLIRAVQSRAPYVQIATWNDWGEGTQIEPSREFGYRDLEVVQKQVRSRFTPTDLRLPHRLWLLRGKQKTFPRMRSALDSVAGLLASGNVSQARIVLTRLEGTVR